MTAWSPSTATFVSSLNVDANAHLPGDLSFKPDGTALYVLDASGSNDVVHYALSTAWDITTATHVSNKNLALNGPNGVDFKPDGTKMFIVDNAADRIYEYALSTAWTTSTATLTSSLSVSAQDTDGRGVFFKPDGTAMFMVGALNLRVFRYDLATPWSVTTASHVSTFQLARNDIASLFFKPDGTAMFMANPTQDVVTRYDLTTAWDITTASITADELNVAPQTPAPSGAFFRPDGSSVFVSGFTSGVIGTVWRYDMAAVVVGKPTVGFIGFGPWTV